MPAYLPPPRREIVTVAAGCRALSERIPELLFYAGKIRLESLSGYAGLVSVLDC
jgi:hypothetical protein